MLTEKMRIALAESQSSLVLLPHPQQNGHQAYGLVQHLHQYCIKNPAHTKVTNPTLTPTFLQDIKRISSLPNVITVSPSLWTIFLNPHFFLKDSCRYTLIQKKNGKHSPEKKM
jgi:hypothetical protein